MGFPWTVLSHHGNLEEMIAMVDVSPESKDGQNFPWDATSWAPVLDAATSIGSTLFFNDPRLRMPAHVVNTTIVEGAVPPKMAYIYVQDASQGNIGPASDVTITNEHGVVLANFTSMRFSEIEASRKGDDLEGLVHQLAWPPAKLSETPAELGHLVFFGDKASIKIYQPQLKKHGVATTTVSSPQEMASVESSSSITVVYVPEVAESVAAISQTAESNCATLLEIVKVVAAFGSSKNARLFVLTQDAVDGTTEESLAFGPLVGLSRIIAAEQPCIWGGLIDNDSPSFPFQAVKYVSGADVVKVEERCRSRGPAQAHARRQAGHGHFSARYPAGGHLSHHWWLGCFGV
jgi:6-methylsalicylic acid synthase